MLYADDTMIMLGDTDASLKETMSTITEFGDYSGLNINWTKSALMLIGVVGAYQVDAACPIPLATSFKYLGIQVTPCIQDYCGLNIAPLVLRFRDRIKTWNFLLPVSSW